MLKRKNNVVIRTYRVACAYRYSTESIEWFKEDQAFSPSYTLAPPLPLYHQHVVSLSQVFLCFAGRAYWRVRGEPGGGGVGGGGKVIRRRESLVLNKSPKTIWHWGTWRWNASFEYRHYYRYSSAQKTWMGTVKYRYLCKYSGEKICLVSANFLPDIG